MNLSLDVDALTLGELVDLGDVIGDDAVAKLGEGKTSPKAVLALVWIAKRREDPTFTLEQARAVKVSSLEFADADKPDDVKAEDKAE
jgi:hypothetical protein